MMNRWRIDEHPLVQDQRALNLQTNGVLMEYYRTAKIPASLQAFHVTFVNITSYCPITTVKVKMTELWKNYTTALHLFLNDATLFHSVVLFWNSRMCSHKTRSLERQDAVSSMTF